MAPGQLLETLPVELRLRILSHFSPHDLAQSARTCKRLSDIAIPLIWNDIELHEVGYHESKRELNVPPPVRDPERRPYHSKQRWSNGQGAAKKAEAFFTMLQTMHEKDPERLAQLTRRVRHLCTTVNPAWRPRTRDYKIIYPDTIQVWHLLPYFSNLETLELHGSSYYSQKQEEQVSEILGPTPRLRFVKLWGYMPRAVPAWLLGAGETLERLELGMLDRPISTNLSRSPNFTPLPHEKLKIESDSDSDSDIEEEDDDNDDDSGDWGSLSGENVIPRPLGGYLSSFGNSDLAFPKLKHLYLCQPAESDYDHYRDYAWSKRAESACYNDWRRILQACLGTLETLVLEQRPAAEYIEGDGKSELEWMTECTTARASKSLREMTRTILAGVESLALQRVYFYGIWVGAEDQLREVLEARGIQCEARLGQWCLFDGNPGTTSWSYWDAAYDSDDDDDDDDDDEEEEGGGGEQEETMRWDSLLLTSG
ncbi:hypothetical protein FHETE_7940 [Fusarium heterosporum]|uniref:F-box domain-containing protein n=1 Tax=Fusarium heterosporum TaxID=42747 RepID=A0A8H5WH55_FUSHE|nr:hypothetical protein FHETE_7940 [Fusarium heterosporum]